MCCVSLHVLTCWTTRSTINLISRPPYGNAGASKIPRAERRVSNMCSECFLEKENKLVLLTEVCDTATQSPPIRRGTKHSRSFRIVFGLVRSWEAGEGSHIFVDLMNVLFSGISSFLLQLKTRTFSFAAVITTTATRGHRLTTNVNTGHIKMLSRIRPFF